MELLPGRQNRTLTSEAMPMRQRPFGIAATDVLQARKASITFAPFARALTFVFTLALRFPAGTAVTLNAVLEVLNTLLLAFAPHIQVQF